MKRFPCAWSTSLVIAALVICATVGHSPGLAAEKDYTLHTFDRKQLSDIYYSEGANTGDLNNDGHVDVIYGPNWYAGPGFETKHEIFEAKPQPTKAYANHFFCWIHDFNGDGWNDVLTVGFPGTPAYVYENPKQSGLDKHWPKHQIFDWVSNESPHWTNLVGDEKPELVCTRDGFFGYATVDWEQPFKTWKFHPISERITDTRFGHGLGVGDVNGDGRADLIHAKGWFEQPANLDGDPLWKHHLASFTNAYGGAEMYAYDVDGDGDNDVITSLAAHDYGLAWYEQVRVDGQPQFKQHLIMGERPSDNRYGVLFTEPHSVNVVDVDGDGLKDIVTGKTYYSHHEKSPLWDAGAVVYWFRLVRGKEGVDWVPYRLDDQAGIGRQLTVSDVNSDGLLDIVVGGMKGAHVLIHRTQSVDQTAWEKAQPKVFKGPVEPAEAAGVQLRGAKAPIDPKTRQVHGAVEGETLQVTVTGGNARPQKMDRFAADQWSGDDHLWWTGGRPGDRLRFELPAKSGKVGLELVLTCARDYGIVRLFVDDKPLDQAIDLYNPEVITTGVLTFNDLQLGPGKHTLTIEIVGANPKAVKSYMVGIDYLRLRGEGETFPEPQDGIKPVGVDGRILNLDFETGTLEDWTAQGEAFAGQPIKGDTVYPRRSDMRSGHRGEYWIGGYEKLQDHPTGTLTSAPFKVTHPYATFLANSGPYPETRIELVRKDTGEVFYKISGQAHETLRQVVVDLRAHAGKKIFIRLVDEHRGGWGHINFDHFRFHESRPAKLTPPSVELVEDAYPHAGLSAQAAAEAMKLPEGFSVTVFAAEPDVQQPIAMAIDDRGRLWIAEAYEYPRRAPQGEGRDRILIFEDTDGDGKFDVRKVFTERLNLVSGLEVGFGGVWVGAAPYLLFIPDANGDDVPDGEPQVLLDGWGYQDTHETLNAFIWGPDGWLYGCHGVFTHSLIGKPGTPDEQRLPINAGIWRYHPTRHILEIFAHGTSNPWGVDFNDRGQAFCTACVIPHLFHVIQGARYQRQAGQHFNPHTYRDIATIADHLHYSGASPHGGNNKSDEAGGGHAHAGAMIYLGGVWPDQYCDQIFMNNIHGQRLNMDVLKPYGSGYVGSHGPDFLLTGDRASQILNLRYGPDGQAYMIDWYDMQACHRNEIEVHDRSNGRIYKISYGEPERKAVDLKSLRDIELAELVLHRNDWYVRHARRILQERAVHGEIAVDAVKRLTEIATSHADETRRLRALWALHVTGTLDEGLTPTLLADASPYVRGWTIQLLAENIEGSAPPTLVGHLERMAKEDPSPVVRLYIASALQKLPLTQRWQALAALASHVEDANDHNLPLMYWYAAEPLAEVDIDRALAFGLAAGESIPLLREFMLRRIGSSDAAASLAALVRGLGKSDEPELQLTFLTAIRAALQGQRQVDAPADWPAVYAKIAGSSNEQVRLQATALGVTFGDAKAMDAFRELAATPTAQAEARQEALAALLAAKDPELVATLHRLVEEPKLRATAIRGLAQYKDPKTASILLAAYGKLAPDDKRAALSTLCARAEYGVALLTAIENKDIPGTDLTADLVRQLQYLENEQINRQLQEVWGNVRETAADKAKLIAEYKQLLASSQEADVALGRAIFAKTCQRCHTLYGVGAAVGPDLTGSNRSDLDYLLSNIVDPSSVMAKEYRQSVLLTLDGQIVTGIVQAEDDKSVTVQTADAVVIIPKDEIEERTASEKSMMPDDQLKQFNDHQVRSLFAYLRGKQQTPILASPENASLLFNGKDLAGWTGNDKLWSVENGEIVGRSTGLRHNEFLVSDMTAGDFRLTFEVKLVDNAGNSGVQFRSEVHHGSVKGYQADIGVGWWGKLYEEHGRALLWDKPGDEYVRLGDWNTYEIVAKGSRIQTSINGKPCVDFEDPDGARRGIFALQLHSGGPTEVRFRNLRLEVLSDTELATATGK